MPRRSLLGTAVTLLLVVLLPTVGVRGALGGGAGDCVKPCCNEVADASASVRPVLPCCRTSTTVARSSPPAPTVASDPVSFVALPGVVLLVASFAGVAAPPPDSTHHPPGSPLYQKHCALLL